MKKILIIEPDPIIRGIYRRKFEISGYQVETVDDGPVALKVLASFKPNLVQMDLMLRGISGIEMIKEIRKSPDGKKVPILVLSSFYRPDLAKEAWQAGANKCISKMDCTPNLALDIVEQMLQGESPSPAFPGAYAPPQSPKTPLHTTSIVAANLAAAESVTAGGPQAPAAEFSTAPANMIPVAPPPSPTVAGIFEESKAREFGAAGGGATSMFRMEIRQEFLRRVPQIQADLRDRVGALVKSKSTTDQLSLLHDLNSSVSSLAGLAGITGFTRIAHISGALDALIKELHKKPSQMTSSVLRTIAHAIDCLNMMFRDLTTLPQEVPHSTLILAVDDEPISRRTVAVALSKASLRCISLESSKMALQILGENQFDLIFLDAEMPEMNGFELCAELRKLPTNKTTPVIFVTSLTNFEIRAQSSLSGGNDLIAKPFLMMELAVKALTYLLKPKTVGESKPGRASKTAVTE